jgi:hypothetical protein
MGSAAVHTCYRCRGRFDVTADELTPLGYLCPTCFDEIAAELARIGVAAG